MAGSGLSFLEPQIGTLDFIFDAVITQIYAVFKNTDFFNIFFNF